MKKWKLINIKGIAKYTWYIIRHKWYVFIECCKLGIIWRGIWHDWHKFLPGEFFPYAIHFNGNEEEKIT